MKVADYMAAAGEAHVASPNTSLVEVAKQLIRHRCSCVVIVKDEKPVGIITKTDVTRAFAEGVSPDMDAKSIMSDNLMCVKADTQTDDLADLIQREFVHHVVVVDDKGIFSGVASSWDVAREVSLDAKAFPYNRELWTKQANTPQFEWLGLWSKFSSV